MRKRPNLEKLAFVASGVFLIAASAFVFGVYSGATRNAVFESVNSIRQSVQIAINDVLAGSKPVAFLQPSHRPGSGVTVNKRPDDGALVLISGFFKDGNGLRLIRRDGTVVARWRAEFSRHFPDPSHLDPPPASDHNVDLHGALIHPDGSVVFNYEYSGTVKLSKCGKVAWTLKHPTHHSIETSEKGGYWIPGRRRLQGETLAGFPPFTRLKTTPSIFEDLILRVGNDGKIIESKSVPRILYDNGLEPLLTATGFNFVDNSDLHNEFLHLNKIGELPKAYKSAFKMFEPGDLVLSTRQRNLVFVVDPDDWRVEWHQIGPWRRQHDPEFTADGTISVFKNNAYQMDLGTYRRTKITAPRLSNIMKFNPATGETNVAYGSRKGQEFLTVIRGKHQPLPDNGFLITEFEGGRIFEVDEEGRTVWEYINRYDDENVLELTEARLYPASYFSVKDWSCSNGAAAQ